MTTAARRHESYVADPTLATPPVPRSLPRAIDEVADDLFNDTLASVDGERQGTQNSVSAVSHKGETVRTRPRLARED